MKKILLLVLIICSFQSNAQNFRNFMSVLPIDTYELKIGLSSVGPKPAINFETSVSYEGNFYLGSRFNYILSNKGNENTLNFERFFNNIDARAFFQYQFKNQLNIDPKVNPYIDLELGLKTIGANVGAQYYLNDKISAYLQIGHGFSNSIYGGFLEDTDKFEESAKDFENQDGDLNHKLKHLYGKKLFISLGFNFKLYQSDKSKSKKTTNNRRARRGSSNTRSSSRSFSRNAYAEKPENNKYRILN